MAKSKYCVTAEFFKHLFRRTSSMGQPWHATLESDQHQVTRLPEPPKLHTCITLTSTCGAHDDMFMKLSSLRARLCITLLHQLYSRSLDSHGLTLTRGAGALQTGRETA